MPVGPPIECKLKLHTPPHIFQREMNPPKCRLCNHEHWLSEPHVFASNTASNKEHASNRVVLPVRQAEGEARGNSSVGAVASGGDFAADRKQRWSRDKYNAYQREYMRKRRAG